MKTLSRIISLICLAMCFAGCETTPDPIFTGNPPALDPTNTNGPTINLADVGRFKNGDLVVVTFSGGPEAVQMPQHDERIKDDGTITLPLIGSIKAVGKSPGTLQHEIQSAYVPKYYKRLNVTVKPFEQFFYVQGQVRQPGRYPYSGEITAMKAITTAGGFTDFANKKKVRLVREGDAILFINCEKLEKDPSQDPKVLPGDQIYVILRRWF
jgi:polysaccharide export outer membrane protein